MSVIYLKCNVQSLIYPVRSSRTLFFKLGVLKSFTSFCLQKKEIPTLVFYFEYCTDFKNSFFYWIPPVATSVLWTHARPFDIAWTPHAKWITGQSITATPFLSTNYFLSHSFLKFFLNFFIIVGNYTKLLFF